MGALIPGCATPGAITQVPRGLDFRHPASEDELVAIVREALARNAQVRVRGSLHSHGAAIFTDPGSRNINVQLDRYDRVLAWDDSKKQVTVQAGIHLGEDPRDPLSSWDKSLNLQLERRGLALPILGGITHQTIGGFLSTGSAGGSLRHELGAAIVKLRVVGGDGRVHELAPNPADPTDAKRNPFYAAGVSMGLLGIISAVTLQCEPSYAVKGASVTARLGTATAPCDPFSDGPRGLQEWLGASDYSRIVIWPQPGVERVQYWSGDRTPVVALDEAIPHETVPAIAQPFVAGLYDEVDRTPPPYSPALVSKLTGWMNGLLADETKPFHDAWFKAIPIDNAISDIYLPTEFTDLFIDVKHTAELMKRVAGFWAKDDRLDRIGPWGTEVYASKRSPFWMSPTYERDAIRLDLMWFKTGQTRPERIYYPQYWELVKDLDFRFHWGKHLSPPSSDTGPAYRRRTQGAEQWDRFLEVRAQLDPKQVFVTRYWREHLAIPPVSAS